MLLEVPLSGVLVSVTRASPPRPILLLALVRLLLRRYPPFSYFSYFSRCCWQGWCLCPRPSSQSHWWSWLVHGRSWVSSSSLSHSPVNFISYILVSGLEDTATLRVTNLSEETTENDLDVMFRPFGMISRIFLAKDKETFRSKGTFLPLPIHIFMIILFYFI